MTPLWWLTKDGDLDCLELYNRHSPAMINQCYIGDCMEGLRAFADAGISARVCVTSPPYWGLRDYGHAGAYGLEASPAEYVGRLVSVFRLVREVLADDGTLWLNMGDSYYSPRVGGAVGTNSSINGSRTQAAFRDSQQTLRSNMQLTNFGSTHTLAAKRRDGIHGVKPKDLFGMPWRLAFALQADGWYLRQDIIWHKPNPMPESVRDRCTKAHEYLFLLSKSERYYYDADAIKEPADPLAGRDTTSTRRRVPPGHRTDSGFVNGRRFKDRNKRSVWTVATEPYTDAHFATFPTKLIEPCILAGSGPGDVVLDPFMGSGTTAQVAELLGRQWIGCEINPDYVALQADRLRQQQLSVTT